MYWVNYLDAQQVRSSAAGAQKKYAQQVYNQVKVGATDGWRA